MEIKNEDIKIITMTTQEYRSLIRENEKMRNELRLLKTLIENAENNNEVDK